MTPVQPDRNFILFAEDDPVQARVLQTVCKRIKLPTAEYVIVPNGDEAISYIKRSELPESSTPRPTIVISDLRMPITDGIELLKWIKQSQESKNIPVFIVTASWNEEVKELAQRLGCAGFYSKNGGLEQFEQLLKFILVGWGNLS